MFTFCHAGKMGDILYSLYFCVESAFHFKHTKFDYALLINKKITDFSDQFPGDDILLTRETAEFIRPLLESQVYVDKVLICENLEKGYVDLNSFRRGYICPYGCEIRDWYYTFGKVTLPRAFWKRILYVDPNPAYKDKILFTLTDRYVNQGLDYTKLKEFRDRLVFIGTDREYQVFQKNFFELDRLELKPEDSLLTVAQYMAGAKGYMSNQTGFYALAELMKINRILLPPDWIWNEEKELVMGPKNNLPLGGWVNCVSFTPKMVASVKEMLAL